MIEEKEKAPNTPPKTPEEIEKEYGTSTEICPYLPIEEVEEI